MKGLSREKDDAKTLEVPLACYERRTGMTTGDEALSGWTWARTAQKLCDAMPTCTGVYCYRNRFTPQFLLPCTCNAEVLSLNRY